MDRPTGALHDTIVAISSPDGAAARGIVRLSGDEAWAICRTLFVEDQADSADPWQGFQRRRGRIRLEDELTPSGEELTLPGELYLFRGPFSYTRQDCAELHLIGSPVVLRWIVDRALELGARLATPGEFTARAFLSGRIDLTEAEGVAAIIRAESDGQLRAARAMMDGELATLLKDWQQRLAKLCGLIEADIDFAEEQITFIAPDQLRTELEGLLAELDRLDATSTSMDRLDVLPRILLLGEPNAGKSTLMNRLSGIDRAICSPVAGTTRDILSAPVQLGRLEAVLLDAAGVAADDSTSVSALIAAAHAGTLRKATQVDILCLVVDGPVFTGADLPSWLTQSDGVRTLIALNKIDLMSAGQVDAACERLRECGWGTVIPIAATTGQGVEALRTELEHTVANCGGREQSGAMALTARQADAIRSVRQSLIAATEEAHGLDSTIDRAELLAFNLREALDALGQVSGEITTDDLLASVFSSFCIGK